MRQEQKECFFPIPFTVLNNSGLNILPKLQQCHFSSGGVSGVLSIPARGKVYQSDSIRGPWEYQQTPHELRTAGEPVRRLQKVAECPQAIFGPGGSIFSS